MAAFATVALLAVGAGFAGSAVADAEGASMADGVSLGGLLLLAFHGVGVEFAVPAGTEAPLVVEGAGRIDLAPLAGTFLALGLLGRAGRASAGRSAGSWWLRGLLGARVAPVHAALCGLTGWAVRYSASFGPGTLEARPVVVEAVVLPLGLAALAGFAGGAFSPRPAAPPEDRARAVVRGALVMAGWGLALAAAGLALLAPFHPDAVRAYLRPFGAGIGNGLTAVAGTLLVLPNLAVWVLFPAMGSCLSLEVVQPGHVDSVCLLSAAQFPPEGGLPGLARHGPGFDLPPPPGPYLLFLLVPLVATLAGGASAARATRAASRSDRAVAGALAGAVFAGVAVLLATASAVELGVSAAGGPVAFALGPEPAGALVASLLWGTGGGAVGALAASRPGLRRDAEVRPAPRPATDASGRGFARRRR